MEVLIPWPTFQDIYTRYNQFIQYMISKNSSQQHCNEGRPNNVSFQTPFSLHGVPCWMHFPLYSILRYISQLTDLNSLYYFHDILNGELPPLCTNFMQVPNALYYLGLHFDLILYLAAPMSNIWFLVPFGNNFFINYR